MTPWPTSIHLWHSLAFPCPPCLSDFNLSWSVLNSPHIFMFSQMIWNGCKIVGFEWKRRHLWWRKQREEFINFSTFPCVDNFSLYRVMKIGMLLIWFPRTQPICCWMSDLDQFACLCRTQEWHTTRADQKAHRCPKAEVAVQHCIATQNVFAHKKVKKWCLTVRSYLDLSIQYKTIQNFSIRFQECPYNSKWF